MPTSKNRSGYIPRNRLRPVPSAIAAVTAQRFGTFAPSLHMTVENTSVQSAFVFFAFGSPVSMSNGPVPWNRSGILSAGPKPFPFFVRTWTMTGPSTFFAFSNSRTI